LKSGKEKYIYISLFSDKQVIKIIKKIIWQAKENGNDFSFRTGKEILNDYYRIKNSPMI
jgi:hypothetical protein